MVFSHRKSLATNASYLPQPLTANFIKMGHRRFISQLFLLAFITALLLVFMHIFQQFSAYRMFSAFSLVFFTLLAMAMYFPSAKAAMSNDKNAFTRMVMLFTFVKMFLAAGLVIGYNQVFKPADNYFLIPFFLTYIVFTGFETMFMSRLGKIKSR